MWIRVRRYPLLETWTHLPALLAQQVAEQRSVGNYHHFFPKAYLSAANPKAESNLIANITFIDGYWNKHRIGKRPPSTYISKFAETNTTLRKTLHTHLIGDMKSYGVTRDDYHAFISRRANAITRALNVRLMSMTPSEAAAAEKDE